MHSCLPQFYSVVLSSCFSHEPALVHALLISKLSNTISLLGLRKSHYINSFLLPAKTRNISVILSFRCEARSTLQGHFALPVYLQDLYFPFTPKHFFLDLERCFGSFRSCSRAAHPGSRAMTNPRVPGRAGGTGTGHRSEPQRRLQPARHRGMIWGDSRLSGPLVVINPRGEFPSAPCLSSEAQVGAGVPGGCSPGCRSRAALLRSGGIARDRAKGKGGTGGEKATVLPKTSLLLAKDHCASSQFLCAKQDIWMLYHSAGGVGVVLHSFT